MGLAAGPRSLVVAVLGRMGIAHTMGAGILMVADILAITRIRVILLHGAAAAGDTLQQVFAQGIVPV